MSDPFAVEVGQTTCSNGAVSTSHEWQNGRCCSCEEVSVEGELFSLVGCDFSLMTKSELLFFPIFCGQVLGSLVFSQPESLGPRM